MIIMAIRLLNVQNARRGDMMGAWDYGVFDNDYSLDSMEVLMKVVDRWILRGDEFDARLAAEIYIALHHIGFKFENIEKVTKDDKTQLDVLIEKLEKMKQDKWHKTWKRPERIVKDINRQLRHLKKI